MAIIPFDKKKEEINRNKSKEQILVEVEALLNSLQTKSKEPDNITVAYYMPNRPKPIIKDIPNTLEAQQSIVEGYIQCIAILHNSLLIVCNEEASLLNLPHNKILKLNSPGGFVPVAIKGYFFVCGIGETENHEMIFKSLTEEQINYLNTSDLLT